MYEEDAAWSLTSSQATVNGSPLIGSQDDALKRLQGLQSSLLSDKVELLEDSVEDTGVLAEEGDIVDVSGGESLLSDHGLEVELVGEDDLRGE